LELRLPTAEVALMLDDIERRTRYKAWAQYRNRLNYFKPKLASRAVDLAQDEPCDFQGIDLYKFLHGPNVPLPERIGLFRVGPFPYTKAFESLRIAEREEGGIWIRPHHD